MFALIKKYADMLTALPYDTGNEARILICRNEHCFGTQKGTDLSKLSEAEIVDLTREDFPEKEILLESKSMDAMIIFRTPYCGKCLEENREITAALDDMAQIIGHKVPVVDHNKKAISKGLKMSTAVMVSNEYALVWGRSLYEAYVAMTVLEKSAEVCTKAKVVGGVKKIKPLEAILMRIVYLKKYSKVEEEHQDEYEG